MGVIVGDQAPACSPTQARRATGSSSTKRGGTEQGVEVVDRPIQSGPCAVLGRTSVVSGQRTPAASRRAGLVSVRDSSMVPSMSCLRP